MILTRENLSGDLQIAFRPVHFARKARLQLAKTRMMNASIMEFIVGFNIDYNCGKGASEEKAQFLFEYGIWAEL